MLTDGFWTFWTKDLQEQARAALARADEAEAVLRELVDTYGPWHEGDCPGDDTCACTAKPLHDRINAVLRADRRRR